MTAETYETQMLVRLESAQLLPAALPTRMWTGEGSIILDVGNGNENWVGTSFAETQLTGVTNIEKTAEGVPKRLSVAVAVDRSRGDVVGSVVGADHGPLTATLYFLVREAAGASLPPLVTRRSDGAYLFTQTRKDDSFTEDNSFRYLGNNEFQFMLLSSHRDAVSDIAVAGNRIAISGAGLDADMELAYNGAWQASASPNPAGYDIWTFYTDGHGNIQELNSDGGITVQLSDPFKSQDWDFIKDSRGLPLVIRGRTGEMAFDNGVWAFEIENRVHDADRLLVDVWSDSIQLERYSGDRFFEFTADIEAGLDFAWPK